MAPSCPLPASSAQNDDDPSNKAIGFTDTFPLEGEEVPVRMAVFTLAVLFEDSCWLDPAKWPNTSPNQKWVTLAAQAAESPER